MSLEFETGDSQYTKSKENSEPNDWHPMRDDVILDVYNSDLNMIVKHGCLRGESMIDNGLCSLWSGIRATYGMNKERVAFQIKILRYINSPDLILDKEIPFGIRVGWSTNESKLRLGDELLSYGYEETGKFWMRNQAEWYGERYSVGDTITCYVDFESEPGNALLYFTKNDQDFELVYRINYEDLQSRPLFPHIFIKNVVFQVNFGQLEPEYPLRSGFRFMNDYHEDDRIRGTLGPLSKEECEVIMMVGLPGSGKSFWTERHCAINTDKKYVSLSTNNIIQQMKINDCDGMINRATQCLKTIFDLAVYRKRNYIIDQTNVFGDARRRKMSLFDEFYRRAVVVIPDDHEYQRRRYKQQIDQGKIIPESFVNQMKAKFDLPEVADVFDDVEYPELAFRDARDLVMYYRHESQMESKKHTDHYFRFKKNNRRLKKSNLNNYSNDRRKNDIHSSSEGYHRLSLSRSKHQHRRFDHRYSRNGSK